MQVISLWLSCHRCLFIVLFDVEIQSRTKRAVDPGVMEAVAEMFWAGLKIVGFLAEAA